MLMPWVLFIVFVLLLLALDLGVFHRSAHVVSFRESMGWSAVWENMSPRSMACSTPAARR